MSGWGSSLIIYRYLSSYNKKPPPGDFGTGVGVARKYYFTTLM
jgi:hypothetical protein